VSLSTAKKETKTHFGRLLVFFPTLAESQLLLWPNERPRDVILQLPVIALRVFVFVCELGRKIQLVARTLLDFLMQKSPTVDCRPVIRIWVNLQRVIFLFIRSASVLYLIPNSHTVWLLLD
jgi:hypothetical protein